MPYILSIPEFFEKKIKKLPDPIKSAAKKTLLLLSQDPSHPSLKTHKIKHSTGHFGSAIFEAYVTMKYRLTWEYGPEQGEITLRNIDNHDECLTKP